MNDVHRLRVHNPLVNATPRLTLPADDAVKSLSTNKRRPVLLVDILVQRPDHVCVLFGIYF
jgi:hypothetical protein